MDRRWLRSVKQLAILLVTRDGQCMQEERRLMSFLPFPVGLAHVRSILLGSAEYLPGYVDGYPEAARNTCAILNLPGCPSVKSNSHLPK